MLLPGVIFPGRSSQASPGDSTLSAAESEISHAGSSQAFPEDKTLSLAESELSHASNSQASPADSTLSLAESEISQAGSSQAGSSQSSLEDSTLSLAESVVSQQAVPKLPWQIALFQQQRVRFPRQVTPRLPKASQEDNTLSPTESKLSQASSPSSQEEGTLQVEGSSPLQAVRCSARLRARQAGTLPREVSEVSQGDSAVPQRVLP